jgi:ribosomal peptide maturation radical SAM protein 1
MPMADPLLPNLAIEQLAAIARREGLLCDVLYGTLLLPKLVPFTMIHSMAGPAIFAPLYHSLDREEFADAAAEIILRLSELAPPGREEAFQSLALEFLLCIDAAETCLDRCLASISTGLYDLIGFSIGFDAQKLPSATLARRLKAREPSVQILCGGTGCDGQMGPALLEAFPEFDAVLQGEAEDSFIPAIQSLLGLREGVSPPTLLGRDTLFEPCTTAEVPRFPSLSTLLLPDYTAFLAQRKCSEHPKRPLTLLIETSRGCWWGVKHHCTFCGIKSVSDPYRSRSSENAYEQIQTLTKLYEPDLLYATDAILDYRYLRDLLPQLAYARRAYGLPLRLFYECKSNLRRNQIALLAAAGVCRLQPGIESFSTSVLKAMRKGVNGLRQVAFLKWAAAYGIELIYGILTGIPEETAADLQILLDLIPTMHHLPPPLSVNRLGLHKFSPYERDTEGYGFCDVRPFELQHLIYRFDDSLLQRLCYDLDYTLPSQETQEMKSYRQRLYAAVSTWQAAYRAGVRLIVNNTQDSLVILRRSGSIALDVIPLTGRKARIYKLAEDVIPEALLARQLDLSYDQLKRELDWLKQRELVAWMDEQVLSLAVPVNADAWADSEPVHSITVQRNESI